MSFVYRKKCRLCRSSKMTKVLKLKSTPIGDDYTKKINLNQKKYPLVLLKCNKCKFVQLSVHVDPNKVYGDYLYVTNTSTGLPDHFRNFALSLQQRKIIYSGAKVLEIGCNDGTLLSFLKKLNCEVLGIDPAKEIIKKLKLPVIRGLYNFQLAKKIGQFDLIIANNVIANIDNLENIFKGLSFNLKNNGKFIMETFSLFGLIKNNLLDNIYHEHISYFSIQPIKQFAKKFGLYLYRADQLKVKGGSLRLFFQKKKPYKNQLKKLSYKISLENKIVAKTSKFKILEKQNVLNNKKFQFYLKKSFKEKKRIYGFGASVGTTTSLYYFKIKKYVKGIFDHEKKRHNLYLPGSKIKVLSPNNIAKHKIDILIIFAWRYAKIILKKIKLNANCKVILPFPYFKILK